MRSYILPITDSQGLLLLPRDEAEEPEPGSLVIKGLHGTAFQRHFDDRLWHSTANDDPVTWEWLLTCRNLVLVYDAEPRASAGQNNLRVWGV